MLQQQSRSLVPDWNRVSHLVRAVQSGNLTPEQKALLQQMPKEDVMPFQAMLQQQQM
jgi:hypothetical protein